jgi:hypothetical protein
MQMRVNDEAQVNYPLSQVLVVDCKQPHSSVDTGQCSHCQYLPGQNEKTPDRRFRQVGALSPDIDNFKAIHYSK